MNGEKTCAACGQTLPVRADGVVRGRVVLREVLHGGHMGRQWHGRYCPACASTRNKIQRVARATP